MDVHYWFDSIPSPGRFLERDEPHGMHYRLDVLGLGVLDVFIPYSAAEGRMWVSQIGQPEQRRG